MIDSVQAMVNATNQNGGLKAGGKTYKVELVVYDSNATQSTAVAALKKAGRQKYFTTKIK